MYSSSQQLVFQNGKKYGKKIFKLFIMMCLSFGDLYIVQLYYAFTSHFHLLFILFVFFFFFLFCFVGEYFRSRECFKLMFKIAVVPFNLQMCVWMVQLKIFITNTKSIFIIAINFMFV